MTKPDPDWTVYTSQAAFVLQAAEQMGADRQQLVEQAGIDPLLLSQEDARIPAAQFFKLYELADELTGDPNIALSVGRISYLAGLNLQLYMGTVCQYFRDYLNLMPSLLKLRGDLGEFITRKEGDLVRLEWRPLLPETGKKRYLSDEMLSASAKIIDSLCVLPIPVIKVHFSYSKPSDTTQLKQAFGEQLLFDQPVSCIYFDRKALSFLMVQQHYESSFSNSHYPFDKLLDAAKVPDQFLTALRQSIIRLLPEGEMAIGIVANELNISKRTLQRRLADRKTQFLQVLQDIRAEYAVRYLADKRLSITEIAFLLGYADPASFSYAFKGWRGVSPSEFRQ